MSLTKLLNPYTVNTFSSADKDRVRRPAVECAAAFQQAHYDGALVSPYFLTPWEIAQLEICYQRRVVKMAAKPSKSSHPIASTMLYLATLDLFREAGGDDRNRRFIDIGGSISKILKWPNAHACNLSNSARDRFRFLSTTNSVLQDRSSQIFEQIYDDIFAHAASGICAQQPRVCLHGAQCCNQPSKFAVCVHALYDLTPQEVHDIFSIHGLDTLLAVLYIPAELTYGTNFSEARKLEEIYDFYHYLEKDEFSYMSFGDNSFCYKHNTINWRNWANITMIQGTDFNIAVEDYEQNGPEHRLRFVRIPNTDGSIPRYVTPGILEGYVEYPDLFDYFWHDCHLQQSDLKTILVPYDYYRRAMSQALKVKELDNNSVYTYIVGITNKIDVNSTVLNKKLSIDPVKLQHFAYSMLWIAAAHRQDSSTGCKVIYEYLKKHNARGGTFENFKLSFSWLFDHFKTWLGLSKISHPTNLSSFDVQPITGYYIDTVVEVTGRRVSAQTQNNTRAQAGRLRKQALLDNSPDLDRDVRAPRDDGAVFVAPDVQLAFDLAEERPIIISSPLPFNGTVVAPSAPTATLRSIVPTASSIVAFVAPNLNAPSAQASLDLADIAANPCLLFPALPKIAVNLPVCVHCDSYIYPAHCCLRLRSSPIGLGFRDAVNCQNCGIVIYPFSKHFCQGMDVVVCSTDPDVNFANLLAAVSSETNCQAAVVVQHQDFVRLYCTNLVHRISVCPVCFVMYRIEFGRHCAKHPEHLLNIRANAIACNFDCTALDPTIHPSYFASSLVLQHVASTNLALAFNNLITSNTGGIPNKVIEHSNVNHTTDVGELCDSFDPTSSDPKSVVIKPVESSALKIGPVVFSRRLNCKTNSSIQNIEAHQYDRDRFENVVKISSDQVFQPTVTPRDHDSKLVVVPRSNVVMTVKGGRFVHPVASLDASADRRSFQFYEFPFDASYDNQLAALPDDKFKELVSQLPSYKYCGLNAARTKLQQIFQYLGIKKNFNLAFDLGCGPGSAGLFLRNNAQRVFGYYYSGVGGEIKPCYAADYNSTAPFDATKSFPSRYDADLVYCDIGPKAVTNSVIMPFLTYASHFDPKTVFILKLYVPTSTDYVTQHILSTFFKILLSRFCSYNIYKPPASHEINSEFYVTFHDRRQLDIIPSENTITYFQNSVWLMENRRMFAVRRLMTLPHTDCYIDDEPEIIMRECTVDLRDGEINSYRDDLAAIALSDKVNAVCSVASKAILNKTAYDCTLVTGPPGCGKTRFYREYIKRKCNSDCIVICSTDDLRRQLHDDLDDLHVPVYTQHNVYKHQGPVRTIFIDEFFTFPVAAPLFYSRLLGETDVKIVLVGDPMQIPDLFSELYPNSRRFTDIFPELLNNFTYRCANDVTDLLSRLGYAGLKTASKITSSISVVNTGAENSRRIIKSLGWPVITFNRSTAGNTGYSFSKTVHGAQGHTFPSVILYVEPKAMTVGMARSIRHVRVALSRHLENVLILGSADGLLHDAFHVNSPVQVNGSIFGQERSDVYEPDLSSDSQYWALHKEFIDLDDAGFAEAVQILDDMIPTNMANINEFAAIQRIAAVNKGRRTCGS